MQLRFELRPVRFLAAQNPIFERALFQSVLKELGDELEMLAGLIGDAAFGVASIVTGEAVPTSAAGKGMKESFALVQLAQAQIEHASAMTIHEDDAKTGECSQQLRDRLQMEMAIDKELRPA
jgi:hypothetical protein